MLSQIIVQRPGLKNMALTRGASNEGLHCARHPHDPRDWSRAAAFCIKQKRVFLSNPPVFILHSNQLRRLFITRPFPVCADPVFYSTPLFSVILSRPRQSSRDITLNISNWRLFVQIHYFIQLYYFQSSSPGHVSPPSRFACTLERPHVSLYGYI